MYVVRGLTEAKVPSVCPCPRPKSARYKTCPVDSTATVHRSTYRSCALHVHVHMHLGNTTTCTGNLDLSRF